MFPLPGNKENQIERFREQRVFEMCYKTRPVIYQSGLRVEELPTDRAEVVFLTGVDSLVDMQLLGNGKSFLTKITLIGLFS